jgi:hypothetical protein
MKPFILGFATLGVINILYGSRKQELNIMMSFDLISIELFKSCWIECICSLTNVILETKEPWKN